MIKGHQTFCGSITAAKAVGISLRQLYHWVDVLHVVEPALWQHGRRKFRRFTAEELEKLKQMKNQVERGYTLSAAVKIVNGQLESS